MQKEWTRLLDPRSIPIKIGFASIVCFYSCYSSPKEPEHVKYMVQKIRPRSLVRLRLVTETKRENGYNAANTNAGMRRDIR